MATANINKGIIAKLDSEISTWFLANKLDFMVISDTGLQQASTRTVWVKGTSGARTPGLILISNRRAGILLDSERWQSRIKKHETQFSPSGRSISISLRLGKRAELKIIATYMPDTPQVNTDETSTERRWIAQCTAKARQQRQIVIVAGDFNTYPDGERDRQGPGIRSSGARRESDKFCAWTEDNGLASTFKYRHPTAERFTYTNGGRSSALDDIYVSRQHAHQIAHSGIWLHSLNHGDHVGTPFVSLRLSQMQQTRRHLVGVTNIKYIDTKKKTPDEMKEYTTVLSELLETGELSLIKPIEVSTATAGATEQWLHDAITNIYKCMYSAGKNIWGEKSQARKEIDRAVSKTRTARCHGQFKAVMRLAARSNTIASDISRAVQKLQWSKWIVDPERLPQLCPHKTAAMELEVWRRQEPPSELHMMKTWLECGWRLWKKVTRIRSGWRQRRKVEIGRQQRSFWFETNGTRRFLRDVLGPPLPPVSIRGALVGDGPEYEYTESREAVRNTLVELLDNWVPSEQKTTELDHLSSWSEQDEETLPQFVKEWLLEDIKAGGTRAEAFEEHGGWESFSYDECMQQQVDRMVNKGVAPGFGGITQEMWIAAPKKIRERERLILNTIIRTGIVPRILNHRQMTFLPKSAMATGVWERQGLPPWRPISVQSSLATRLFTAISSFLEARAPNHPAQHGFQRDRNVQDASLATTLLMDRAKQRKEPLYILSKDCEKCYDRIPKWVMAYIYKRLGVPRLAYNILMTFLSAAEIDVRTCYGWIPSGTREFGLGQGSALSIRHIGYYMDILLERQQKGPGGEQVRHNQGVQPSPITSIVLVDDVIDVAATRAGIDNRVNTSNIFTGVKGTGGVFGAAKSFLMYYHPRRSHHEDSVFLNDGLGNPREVTVVSPGEGFKHLGVQQSTDDVWSISINPTWNQLKADADRMIRKQISVDQLRYIVNHVWIPRFVYRTQLDTSLKTAEHADKLVRRVARQILRLPQGMASNIYHDHDQGIGLNSFVDECRIARTQLALRVLNTHHTTAHHLMVEALEYYQISAGLTQNPLEEPIPPPSHLHDWIHQTIRAASEIQIRTNSKWINPPECTSSRPNDRSIWLALSTEEQQALLGYNIRSRIKVRFIGDVVTPEGTSMLTSRTLAHTHRWTRQERTDYEKIEPMLRCLLCHPNGTRLIEPVGYTIYDVGHLQMQTVDIAPEGFFIACEFEVVDEMPVLRGYELGKRVGSSLIEGQLGTEIKVQWWHERTPNSDIWTVRPGNWDTEYVDSCFPVEVTYLTRRSTSAKEKVIVWTDTAVNDQVGRTDRQVIHQAFRRLKERYMQMYNFGNVTTAERSCSECKRLQNVSYCVECTSWHHTRCKICADPQTPPRRTMWAQLTTSLTAPAPLLEPIPTAAGDGSVIGVGSTRASGAWAVVHGSASVTGNVKCYWADITSTRYECHALIAGLHLSGDSGVQVCDNKAAIQILQTARQIALAQRTEHMKFTNTHRVEIRTMVKLMRTSGDFRAVWVKSHQESTRTDDPVLRDRRNALAIADAAAAEGHTRSTPHTYSNILEWDTVTLLDCNGRPILGKTRSALVTMAREHRRRAWVDHINQKGEHRQTIVLDVVNTATLLKWNDYEKRFYWRAISHVLHTNARKHLIDSRWQPHCWICPDQPVDTQAHRFGAGGRCCISTGDLRDSIAKAIRTSITKWWSPDQEYYIPEMDHGLAAATHRTTRTLNPDRLLTPGTWKPLINGGSAIWVNARNMTDLVRPDAINYGGHLFWLESQRQFARPAGRLVPRCFQRTAQACTTSLAHLGYHPSQLCGVWNVGTLHIDYPSCQRALKVRVPPDSHCSWWIDDVFCPYTQQWWAVVQDMYKKDPSDNRIVWIACYGDTEGYKTATKLGVEWYVNIPVNSIKMRTELSVRQTDTDLRRAFTAKNPKSIWIGVVKTSITHEEDTAFTHEWVQLLDTVYTTDWLCSEHTAHSEPNRDDRISMISWTSNLESSMSDDHLALNRRWLVRRHPSVYEAPIGWRVWPSASTKTMEWARSLSHTTKRAKQLHDEILQAIWAANRVHWSNTCGATVAAIEESAEAEIWTTVNTQIKKGRRVHDQKTSAMDTALARHTEALQRRSTSWHQQRARGQPEYGSQANSDPRTESSGYSEPRQDHTLHYTSS